MGHRTPIYPRHVAAGAKIVDFAGWDMPIHYGSQIEEHHAVRQDVGVCDVSHMTVVDIFGDQSEAWMSRLVCNDVARLDCVGKALYTGMLNEKGCILDDLIVYRTEPGFRVVVNCATRDKDLAWMEREARGFDVDIVEQPTLAILAVQGPNSLDKVKGLLDDRGRRLVDSLTPFTSHAYGDWFIARTGYTGEAGVEIILPGNEAVALWDALVAAGVKPVGLGARDTLRLEAGMNLYGHDMDETVTPYESNMGFTVVMDGERDFVGKSALAEQNERGVTRRLVGLVMTERGVLREHYPIFEDGRQVGEITSGVFSPTLQHSIALARITSAGGALTVEIRGKQFPVYRVRPPFVRNGKRVYKPIDEIANQEGRN